MVRCNALSPVIFTHLVRHDAWSVRHDGLYNVFFKSSYSVMTVGLVRHDATQLKTQFLLGASWRCLFCVMTHCKIKLSKPWGASWRLLLCVMTHHDSRQFLLCFICFEHFQFIFLEFNNSKDKFRDTYWIFEVMIWYPNLRNLQLDLRHLDSWFPLIVLVRLASSFDPFAGFVFYLYNWYLHKFVSSIDIILR